MKFSILPISTLKDLMKLNEIAGGCFTRYQNANEYIWASITGCWAGVSNRQIGINRIILCQLPYHRSLGSASNN